MIYHILVVVDQGFVIKMQIMQCGQVFQQIYLQIVMFVNNLLDH